jgi:hypothetical protein
MARDARTYDSERVATQSVGAPLINPGIASADTFGLPIAEGAQRGMDAAYRGHVRREAIEREEKEKVDNTEAMSAYLKVSEADGKLMSQSRLKKGANARGLPEQYNTEYNKIVEEHSKALANNTEAMEVFRSMSERRRVGSITDIQRHADVELDNHLQDTWESAQIQSRNDIMSGTVTIDEGLNLMKGNRDYLSEMRGIPKIEADILWQNDKDKTIGGLIEQNMKAGDNEAAQKTFDQYGKELSSELKAEIQGQLKLSGDAKKAQTYAAVIMENPRQTKAQAYQQLKVIDDPVLQEKTRIHVDREFAQREAVKSEAQGTAYEEAADAIDSGESVDSLIAKDPLIVGLLDENQMANLRRVEKNAIDRKQPEEWGPEYTAMRNASSEYPEDFAANTDLRKIKGLVTKSEYDDLNQRQQAIKAMMKKADGKIPPIAKGFITINQTADTTLRGIGINPNVEDGKVDPRASKFKQLLDKKVRAAGGVEVVTPEQVQQFSDELLLEKEVVAPSGLVGKSAWYLTAGLSGFAGVGVDGTKKVRTFDLPNAERMAFSIDQIPAVERKRAIDALSAVGIKDPTPDELMEYYNGSLKGEVTP